MNFRRNRLLVYLLACLLAFAQMPVAFGEPDGNGNQGELTSPEFNTGDTPKYLSNQILITYDSRFRAEALRSLGTTVEPLSVAQNGMTIARMMLNRGTKVEEAIATALREPGVIAAQPNFLYQFSYIPNDLLMGSGARWRQWLDHVNALDAWDYARTDNQVTIAVVDTGAYLTHEDLAANIDLAHAYDATANRLLTDTVALEGGTGDIGYSTHGTNVCGIAGAVANNLYGGAGVSYNANILPVRVGSFLQGQDPIFGEPDIASSDILSAYNYLIDLRINGLSDLKIINLSFGAFGTGIDDSIFRGLIVKAESCGIITIAGAGNPKINTPKETEYYPSDWPKVFSVMAIEDNNTVHADFPINENKNICAPGFYIETTAGDSGYSYRHGTSFASPIVAGIAALLWAANPNLTVDEVKQILIDSATPMDVHSGAYGFGRVNAEAAVIQALAMQNTCEIGSTSYTSLTNALTAVGNGQTIRLLKNLDYNTGVVISAKTVTFDLNGFALSIRGALPNGNALEVTNGGKVMMTDTSQAQKGRLSVIGSGTGYGIIVDGGGSVRAHSARAAGASGGAIWAKNGEVVIEHWAAGSTCVKLGNPGVTATGANTGFGYRLFSDGCNSVWIKNRGPGSGDFFDYGYATLDVSLVITRIVSGVYTNPLSPEEFAAIDMDYDGVITLDDAYIVMCRALGLL